MEIKKKITFFYSSAVLLLVLALSILFWNNIQKEVQLPATKLVTLSDAAQLLPKTPFCQFDPRRYSAVLLYSAPVATAVYLLNGYEDPTIRGIFKYYLFHGQRYSGPITWSGITLSVGQLRTLPLRTLIYADPSDDLTRSLKASRKDHQVVDLISALPNVSSAQLWRAAMAELIPKMIQSPLCLERVKWLEHWVKTQEAVLDQHQTPHRALFFLGPVAEHRLPSYLMANDLLVRDLVRRGRLHWPWPSFDRGVLNWSQRQLRLQHGTQYFGLAEELQLPLGTLKIEPLGSGRSNLYMAGALLPGISQLILQVLLVQSGVMI